MDEDDLLRPEDWTGFDDVDEAVDDAAAIDGSVFDAGTLSRRLETMSGVRHGYDEEAAAALINRSRERARSFAAGVKPQVRPEIRVVNGRGMGLEEMIQLSADVGQPFKVSGDTKVRKKGAVSPEEGLRNRAEGQVFGVADGRVAGTADGRVAGVADGRVVGVAKDTVVGSASDSPLSREERIEKLTQLLPAIAKRPLAHADLMSRVSVLQDPKFPSVSQIRSMLDEVGKADPFARAAMADLPFMVAPWSKTEAKRIIADELRLDLTYNGVDYSEPSALKDGKLDPARRLAAEAIVNYAVGAARQGRYSQSGLGYRDAFGMDLFGSSIREQGQGAGALMQRARYRVGEAVTPYTLDLPKKVADYLFPRGPEDTTYLSSKTPNEWIAFGLSAFLPQRTRDKVSDILLPFGGSSAAQYLTATRLRSMFVDPATGERIPAQGVFMDADGRFRLASVQDGAGGLSIPGYTRGTMFGAPGTGDPSAWSSMRDISLYMNTVNPIPAPRATVGSPKLMGGRVLDAYDPGAWIDLADPDAGGWHFSGVYSDKLKNGRKKGKNFIKGLDSATFSHEQVDSMDLSFSFKLKSGVQLDHVVSLSWAYEHGGAKILRDAFESGKYQADPRWDSLMTILQTVGASAGDQWAWTSSEFNRIKSDKGPAQIFSHPDLAPFFAGHNDRRQAVAQRFLAARQQLLRLAHDRGWTDPDYLAIPREDQLAIEMAKRGWYDSNRFLRPLQELYLDRIDNPNLMDESLHRQINGTIAATAFNVGWSVATWKYVPANQVYLLLRGIVAPSLNAAWNAPFGNKWGAAGTSLRDAFGGGHPFSLQKRFAFQEFLGPNGDISKFQKISREMAFAGLESDIVHKGQVAKSFSPHIGTATWRSGFLTGFGSRDAFGAPKDVVAPSHMLSRVDHESFSVSARSPNGHIITGNASPLDWVQLHAHQRYVEFLRTGDESLIFNASNPAFADLLGNMRTGTPVRRGYRPWIVSPLEPGSQTWNDRLNFLQNEARQGINVTADYIDANPYLFYDVQQYGSSPQYGWHPSKKMSVWKSSGSGVLDPSSRRAHWLSNSGFADRVIGFSARESALGILPDSYNWHDVIRERHFAKGGADRMFAGVDDHAAFRELIHGGLMKDATAFERSLIRLNTSSVDGRANLTSGVAIAEAFGALSDGGWKTRSGWSNAGRSVAVDMAIRSADYGFLRNSDFMSNMGNLPAIWGIEAGYGFLASKADMTSHAVLDTRSYDFGRGGFFGGWTRVRSQLASQVGEAREAMKAAERMPTAEHMARRYQRLERAAEWRFKLQNATLFGDMTGAPLITPHDALLEQRLLRRIGWGPDVGLTDWRDLFTASGKALSPNPSWIPDQGAMDALRAIKNREARQSKAMSQFEASRERRIMSSERWHSFRDQYLSSAFSQSTAGASYRSAAEILAEADRINQARDLAIETAKINLQVLSGYQRVVEENLAATPGANRLLAMKPGMRRTIANIAATHPAIPIFAGRMGHAVTKGVYESARAPFRLLSKADGYIKRTPGLSRTISGASFASIGLGYVESVARTRTAMGLLERDWYSLSTSEKAALDKASRWSFFGAALDVGFSNSVYEAGAASGLAVLNIGSAEYIRANLPQAAKDDRDSRILAHQPRRSDEEALRLNEEQLLRQGLLMPMRNSLMDPRAFFKQDSAYKARYYQGALERAEKAGSKDAIAAVRKVMARQDSAYAADLRLISSGARDVVSKLSLESFDRRNPIQAEYKGQRFLQVAARPFVGSAELLSPVLPDSLAQRTERFVDRVDSSLIRAYARGQQRSDLARSAYEMRQAALRRRHDSLVVQHGVQQAYMLGTPPDSPTERALNGMRIGFGAFFGLRRSSDSLDLARDVAQRSQLSGQRLRALDTVRNEKLSLPHDRLAPYRGGN